MGQTLLFPDPRPLDQRLGRRFFRKAPRKPGVYLMKDANDNVLYVGKAKDLKQRLNNYRLANPDRMPRRHLRMIREVSRIDFQFCADEAAALRCESKFLRSLRPKFNRAGVWPGKPRFIVWRAVEHSLQLGVVKIPEPGWRRFGPLNGGSALALYSALSRLLWLAMNSQSGFADLPAGWGLGRLSDTKQIDCRLQLGAVLAGLDKLFWQNSRDFLSWLGARCCERQRPFERAAMAADMETLQDFAARSGPQKHGPQYALL